MLSKEKTLEQILRVCGLKLFVLTLYASLFCIANTNQVVYFESQLV